MVDKRTHSLALQDDEKVALMKEAEDLANRLRKQTVERLDPHSNSTRHRGVGHTHLKTFVSFLRQSRDLERFRGFLAIAPKVDRATAQNQPNPLAHHKAAARVLLEELDAEPDRRVETWIWVFSWTNRLLQAGATPTKPQPDPGHKRSKRPHDREDLRGNSLALQLGKLYAKDP